MQSSPESFARRFAPTLSRTERHVLMLFYAEELTIAEIGLVLGLPAHRIEQMLESLRTRTREALAQAA